MQVAAGQLPAGAQEGGRRSAPGNLQRTEGDPREFRKGRRQTPAAWWFAGQRGAPPRPAASARGADLPELQGPVSAELRGGSCAFQNPRYAKLGTGKRRGEGSEAEVAERGLGNRGKRVISKFCIPSD